MISILIADDHFYIQEGIQNALEGYSDVAIVGKASSLTEIEKEIETKKPAIVLLDIMFGEEKTGLVFAENYLKKIVDPPHFIMFSQYDDIKVIKSAFSAGAKSFLTKNTSPEELYEAIQAVFNGGHYIPAGIEKKLAASFVVDQPVSLSDILSEREYDIFIGIAEGKTQQEIAGELNLHLRTIANSYKDIKDKLKIERPVDFTKLALKNKLID